MTKSFLLGEMKAPRNPRLNADYLAYLMSPEWAELRNVILERDGYECQRCGATAAEAVLDVHHLTYEQFGNEAYDDLQTLCRECHEEADEERRWEARVEAYARKRWGIGWRKWVSFGYAEKALESLIELEGDER